MAEVIEGLGDRLGAQALGVALDGLDQLGQLYWDQVNRAMPLAQRLPDTTAELWHACCRAVVAGQTGVVQARRQEVQRAVARNVEYLRRLHGQASRAAALTGRDVPGAEQLPRLIAEMERGWARALGRWETAEDLEDLVAEATAPAPEQLEAVASKHGFPQGWYDQDSKPF